MDEFEGQVDGRRDLNSKGTGNMIRPSSAEVKVAIVVAVVMIAGAGYLFADNWNHSDVDALIIIEPQEEGAFTLNVYANGRQISTSSNLSATTAGIYLEYVHTFSFLKDEDEVSFVAEIVSGIERRFGEEVRVTLVKGESRSISLKI